MHPADINIKPNNTSSGPSFYSQENSAHGLELKKDISEFYLQQCGIQRLQLGCKPSILFFCYLVRSDFQTNKKHLQKRIDTSLGHMRVDGKNVRSTKPKNIDMITDASKNHIRPPVRDNQFHAKLVNLSVKVHSDQTCRFPVTPSKGNKCMVIAYDYDCNAILECPLKSKSDYLH